MHIIAFGLHKPVLPQSGKSTFSNNSYLKIESLLSKMPVDGEALFVHASHSAELFIVSKRRFNAYDQLHMLFESYFKQSFSQDQFHKLTNEEAVRHFFQLTLGLESFIDAGHNDFMEHVHSSLKSAERNRIAGPVMQRLYQRGLILQRKFEQSHISLDYSSLASQITKLLKKIFGPPKNVNVLVIGHNDLAEPVLFSLPWHDMKSIAFVPPEDENAHTLAESMNANVLSPQEGEKALKDVHVVVRLDQNHSEPFTLANLQHLMATRKNQPLLLLHLDSTIVPDPELGKIYNLFVYHIDDFQHQKNDSVSLANQLVEEELRTFFSWFYSKERYRFGDIIGKSRAIESILEMIARISQTNITVLIQGDSGTGKELVARAIHKNSPRCDKPFIVVNCGALPDTLLESELFGHVKGAFTGASFEKRGLLEEADGGTLLLDEIGDTSPAFQVKLLRVLQQGEMRRLGSNTVTRIDVRIIAATNTNLSERVQNNRFRKDLYYRLNVVQIDVPPLSARPDDILLLSKHFIQKYAKALKKRIIGIDKPAEEKILLYHWPGNVRELENAMEHAVALAIGHRITPEDLPTSVRDYEPDKFHFPETDVSTLKQAEREHIKNALEMYGWNYDLVAKKLDIGRTTLWRKMREFGISRDRHKESKDQQN